MPRTAGERGGVQLQKSTAWFNFVKWLRGKADDRGWARTTAMELARVLYPIEWQDGGKGDEVSHKLATFRRWVSLGYVHETGMREQVLGHSQAFYVGLTLKGVAACHDIGLSNVPQGVVPTPSKPIIDQPVVLPQATVLTPTTVTQVRSNAGPPPEIKAERINEIRKMRDGLTYALYLLDHPVTCQRKHVDDLTADELFDLAVAKAKAQ